MSNSIAGLFVDLRADSAAFSGDLAKSSKQLKSFSARTNKSLAKMQRNFGGLSKSMSRFSIGLNPLSGALAGLAAGGLYVAVKKSLELADSIGKAADNIGITTTALQEYRHAAMLSGVENENLDTSFKQFAKRIGEARAGTGSLVTFLKLFDKQLLANLKTTKTSDQALNLVFTAMGKLTKQTDRAALASAAFGRSGIALTRMVTDSTMSLKDMRDEAHKLGLVLSDEMIRNSEAANDQLSRMEKILGIKLIAAVASFAPEIGDLAQRFIDGVPAIIKWVDGLGKFLGLIGKSKLEGLNQELGKLELKLSGVNQELSDPLLWADPANASKIKSLAAEANKWNDQAFAIRKKISAIQDLHKVTQSKKQVAAEPSAALSELPKNLKTGPAAGSFRAAQDVGIKDILKEEIAAWARVGEKRKAARAAIDESTKSLILENDQTRRMITATNQGAAAVTILTRALEFENETKRLGVNLSSEKGAAWSEEFIQAQQLTRQLDEVTAAQEKQAAAMEEANILVSAGVDSVSDSISRSLTDVMLYGKSWDEVGKNFTRNFIDAALSGLIKMGAQMAINFALSEAFSKKKVASSAAEGGTIATAYAPAAAAVSLATAGGNAFPALAGLAAVATAAMGIASFAKGGDFGGGLRIVGERGPELEATGPSRIFNANQTQKILGGQGGGNGGAPRPVNINVNFSVSTVSAQGMREVIRDNGPLIASEVNRIVRDSGRQGIL